MKLAVAIAALCVVGFSIFWQRVDHDHSSEILRSSKCGLAGIYNFGDSNSDTGGVSATFRRVARPYGQTFFGKPSGRYSDGRLIVDFFAKKLGIPYLSAYLDSIGSSFKYGANFASSGSTIQSQDTIPSKTPINPITRSKTRINPISLGVQVSQFEQFKARTLELHDQGENSGISNLPKPNHFSRSLYTVDSGQNDLHLGLTSETEEQVKASLPSIIHQFSSALERLYKQGARAFWIHNTGPIGCLPFFVLTYPPKPDKEDQNGCVKSFNEVAREFNKMLKQRVSQLRDQLQDATLVYVDMYSAKYSLISNATRYGFVDPLGFCCGVHGSVGCGQTVIVDGVEVHGAACEDPAKDISWDGAHYSEAANKWVADHIADGSFSDPPIPISEVCPLPFPSNI